MKIFKCNISQTGYFAGPVYGINKDIDGDIQTLANPHDESKRFEKAKNIILMDIKNNNTMGENREVLETLNLILEDEIFCKHVKKAINEGLSAVAAVKEASNKIVSDLDKIDSLYIRSRREDILGLSERLEEILTGKNHKLNISSVICGDNISPAKLVAFDNSLIGGLLTDKGSPNSHVSVLAGNLGIPYLYGSSEAVKWAMTANFIILDGDNGTVVVDPDENLKAQAIDKMRQINKDKRKDDFSENVSCKTRVYANIGGIEDIDELIDSGADGVGLFRTEFLFINSEKAPTEEEQYMTYRAVAEAMGDKEVIIRTMDIGSDKSVKWLKLPKEPNPALGLRGIRVSMEYPELFKTQIRALLRSAVYGNIKVMFPMITSSFEIDWIIDFIQNTANELDKEDIKYCIPPLGVMIETPSAAICAGSLAKKVAFFSIGTNDLTQYTLAIDRESEGMDRFLSDYEAIFTLIKNVVKSGYENGISTAVCGQMAADSNCIRTLIEAGVEELSVPVKKVKYIKSEVAKIENDIAKSKKKLVLRAVADGELIPMNQIEDKAFSSGTMGKCFGIMPKNGKIYSPVSGTVKTIAKTGHAISIESDDGRNILVHVGIDTVKLGKKAFSIYVKEGEKIEGDQLLLEADLEMIQNAGLSSLTIVAVLDN